MLFRSVKGESGSEGTIDPLCMINLVKHEKKLNSALPVKLNLQHVKRRNVILAPSYTTTKMDDDEVAHVESDLQWLRDQPQSITSSQKTMVEGWKRS